MRPPAAPACPVAVKVAAAAKGRRVLLQRPTRSAGFTARRCAPPAKGRSGHPEKKESNCRRLRRRQP